MTKLKNIQGYWNMSGEVNFNNNDMWEGKLLLEDDGWFEGIVVDPNSSYKKDRFVFGVYHPEKVIELLKFTPISVSAPFVFHGTKTEEGYDGEFEVIGYLGSTPCGVSRLITSESEFTNEELDSEIEEVKTKIQNYKDSTMDEYGRTFYDNTIAMRSSMCKIILKNYEGTGYTDEEKAQIEADAQQAEERITTAIEEDTKKLVKTIEYPKDSDPDDWDLPF